MKIVLIFISLFLSLNSFAESSNLKVACKIQEILNGSTKESALSIESSTDKHGAILYPKLQQMPEVDLMVALYDGLIIVNAYHNPTGISSASHSDITGSKYAHYQMDFGAGKSVTVHCTKE